MTSQAESTPELDHEAKPKQRQAFASSTSSTDDFNSSLGGPSHGDSSYLNSSLGGPSHGDSSYLNSSLGGPSPEIGELHSTGLPEEPVSSGSGNSDNFEVRLKRYAERRAQRKRKTALLRNKAPQTTTKSVATDGQTPTTPTLKEQNEGKASVQELLIQKGLPITSLGLIDSGNFAKVYKGMWTQEGPGNSQSQSVVAVKVIKSVQSHPRLGQDGSLIPPKWLQREVKTNLAQHHENLVRVIDTSLDTLPYAIVLEYCPGGSLFDSVKGDPSSTLQRFTWKHRLKAALDVALGMAHLHKQTIVHRDLKTRNVLLSASVLSPGDAVLAKVCDFGLARYLPNDDLQTRLTLQVGSWNYMAPELFDSDCKQSYDGAIDVYSYAVLLYEMLAGDLHYENKEDKSFVEFVMFTVAGGRPREDAIPEGAPEALRVLMTEAWSAEPSERPAFSVIAERLREDTRAQFSRDSSTWSLGGVAACFSWLRQ